MVRQSNAVSTAAYSLPRNSKRLVYLSLNALSNYKVLKFNAKESGYEVEIFHTDYGEVFGDKAHASRDVSMAAKALRKNGIIIYQPENDGDDGEKGYGERNWINGFDHNPKEGKTTLYFHPFVAHHLEIQSKTSFTRYMLKYVSSLNNIYAMRLYETICQWRNMKDEYIFKINWMLERYQMPKSYKRIADFRDKFLKIAVNEINKVTDVDITDVIELCRGKRKNSVTHIHIKWKCRDNDSGTNVFNLNNKKSVNV